MNNPPIITVEEAMRRARRHSDELGTAGQLLDIAQRRYTRGIRSFLPTVSLSLSGSDRVTIGGPDARSKQFAVAIRQPLYHGGRSYRKRSLEQRALALQREELQQQREKLLDRTWMSFYEVVVLRRQTALQQRTFRRARAQLEIAKTQLELGRKQRLEVLESELRVKRMEVELQRLRTKLKESEYHLRQLLSYPSDRPLELDAVVDSDYRGHRKLREREYYTQLTLSRNFELRKQRFEVRRNLRITEEAKSRFLPNIDLTGKLTFSGQSLPLQGPGYTIGFRVTFPVSAAPVSAELGIGEEHGNTRSRNFSSSITPAKDITASLDRTEAQLRLRASRKEEERLISELRFNVQQALIRYRSQQARLSLLRRQVLLQQSTLQVVREQFESGHTTRNILLEAMSKYAAQRLQLLEEVLALLQRGREIERIIGLPPGELSAHTKKEEER